MTAKVLPNDMNELASMWLAAKKQEEDATADRRDIEDHIKKLATIAENLEGTETVEPGRFEIKIVGRIGERELFVVVGLFTVLAAAGLMHALHLSTALGAFVAGVMLADSPYRHELEADVEPFRSILLGLLDRKSVV